MRPLIFLQILNKFVAIKGRAIDSPHDSQECSKQNLMGKISKEDYDKWRCYYPELDKTKCWAKVPSQELSNLPVQDI